MTQPVEFLYVVPVGAIIPWIPPPPTGSMAVTPPPGFEFCDGSTVNDPDSPFNGSALPDLRSRFLLGTAPGWTQVAAGQALGDPAVNTGGFSNGAAIGTGSTQASAADEHNNDIVQGTGYTGEGWRYVLSDDTSKYDGNHHHIIDAGGISFDAPGSIGVYYIMRIK